MHEQVWEKSIINERKKNLPKKKKKIKQKVNK